jgi:thioesterase domain-containing protein
MTPAELEDYLHSHIPLTATMQVSVKSIAPEGVVVSAPLAPNINHRETAFGGSISTLATLSAWALVHTRLKDHGLKCRVVIQRNSMEYTAPVTGEFCAASQLTVPADWERFFNLLIRRGKARIAVAATVACNGENAGEFSGEFVAILIP